MFRFKPFLPLLLIFLFSCSSRESLEGKWAGRDENGDYMELWFSEDHVLSYFQGYDAFVLYDYSLDGETIRYEFAESTLPETNPFENRIAVMDRDTLILEYVWPNGSHQYYHYQRISSETPEIYPTLAEYREKYLKEIMDASR